MLSMVDVDKSYGRGARRTQILRKVSLSVSTGEIVAVVGTRGEGRTTLLRVAAGQVPPDAGQVLFGKVDLMGLSARKRRGLRRRETLLLGRPPRTSAARLSVYDIVVASIASIEGCGVREGERLASYGLERVGAAECASLPWHALSRWDELLVMLTRVATTRRRLILLDDLFDDLTTRQRQDVRQLLCSLVAESGCGILLSASDLQSAWVSDRVWCLSQGALALMPNKLPPDPNVIALPGDAETSADGRDRSMRVTAGKAISAQASARIDDVPAMSRFSGITIAMYFDDHPPPHFHARSGEFSVKIRTDTLEPLAGDLPRRELRLVLAWAELHASELQDNWRRARAGEKLHAIEPLR
jgi:ABC-type cobalamin/Fe3+-siderophores transport system ATPase subunit